MAKAKEETKMEPQTQAETTVAVSRESSPSPSGGKPQTTTTPAEQEMREWCFQTLWCAWRTTKGATKNEITKNMQRIRNWVGEVRAEELEAQWRGRK